MARVAFDECYEAVVSVGARRGRLDAAIGVMAADSEFKADHLDDLVRFGTLTRQAARFLEAAVVASLNILITGGTQAGKTTMVNCPGAAIPAKERVVTYEEVFEFANPRLVHT